jgi:hypothetical protein
MTFGDVECAAFVRVGHAGSDALFYAGDEDPQCGKLGEVSARPGFVGRVGDWRVADQIVRVVGPAHLLRSVVGVEHELALEHWGAEFGIKFE